MRVSGSGTDADPIVVRVSNEMINDLVRGKVLSWSFLADDGQRLVVNFVPALGGRFMTYGEVDELERAAYRRAARMSAEGENG